MYNRYIPQPDGSYRRSREPDRCPPAPSKHPAPCPPPEPDRTAPAPQEACPPACEAQKQEAFVPPPPPCKQESCPPPRRTRRQEGCPQPCPACAQDNRPPRPESQGSIGGFFRQLLPKDLDTGDLLIILLLLLMSGDCAEDQNTALLTLALYLFM